MCNGALHAFTCYSCKTNYYTCCLSCFCTCMSTLYLVLANSTCVTHILLPVSYTEQEVEAEEGVGEKGTERWQMKIPAVEEFRSILTVLCFNHAGLSKHSLNIHLFVDVYVYMQLCRSSTTASVPLCCVWGLSCSFQRMGLIAKCLRLVSFIGIVSYPILKTWNLAG